MSWNKPTDPKIELASVKRKRHSLAFSFIGMALLVGIGILVITMYNSSTMDESKSQVKKSEPIKEIASAKPQSTTCKIENKEEHSGMVKFNGKWYPKFNKAGGKIWICGDKVLYHSPVIHTNKLSDAAIRKERQYFDTRVDVDLAVLANTPLGINRIGPAKPYGKNFEQQFLESLKTPVIVSKDDPEDVKLLKHTVIETKKELKALYDNGEDIVAIMNDTVRQMKELALYKNELQNLVNSQLKEAPADQDKAVVYEAANKMLSARGVPPMKLPYLLGRRLELQSMQDEAQSLGK